LTVLVLVVGLAGCTKTKETAPPPAKGPEPEPAAVEAPPPGAENLVQKEEVKPPAKHESPSSPDYWGIDKRSYMIRRAVTANLGYSDPRSGNPRTFGGFSYASIDMTGKDWSEPDVMAEAIERLSRLLVEQKILTMARPITVVGIQMNADGVIPWEVGIPVVEGTEVKGPLVLKKIRSEEAFVKDYSSKEYPTREPRALTSLMDEDSYGSMQVLKAADQGLIPECFMIRWANYWKTGFGNSELRFEIVVPVRKPGSPEELRELQEMKAREK